MKMQISKSQTAGLRAAKTFPLRGESYSPRAGHARKTLIVAAFETSREFIDSTADQNAAVNAPFFSTAPRSRSSKLLFFWRKLKVRAND